MPAEKIEESFLQKEELEALAIRAATLTVSNAAGADDKASIIAYVYYTDGSSPLVQVAATLPRGKSATMNLKNGVGVRRFSVYCRYAGSTVLRHVASAETDQKNGFSKCYCSWVYYNSLEETLAYGS